MRKSLIFFCGFILGTLIGYFVILLFQKGIGNNSGSEFFGDTYADLAKKPGGGIGNNSNSRFYSDLYIKEILMKENN